jgi:hypothetical protein
MISFPLFVSLGFESVCTCSLNIIKIVIWLARLCDLHSWMPWINHRKFLQRVLFLVKRVEYTACYLVGSIFRICPFPETRLLWDQYVFNMFWSAYCTQPFRPFKKNKLIICHTSFISVFMLFSMETFTWLGKTPVSSEWLHTWRSARHWG